MTICAICHHHQKVMGLLRDVKIKEQLYTTLLQKTEALSVMKAGTIGDITILDLSTLPKLPKSSKASIKLVLGFIVGAILAIVALTHAYDDECIVICVRSRKRLPIMFKL